LIFLAKIFGGINFYVYFCSRIKNNMERNLLIELLEDGEKVSLYSLANFLSLLRTNKLIGGTIMKTNRIMDDIRSTISPEMKLQMELSVAIANRIYEILEARGMSQKDLARRLGKTETEVSRWLSGTHNLTMATICKISAALDAEVVKVADYELEPACA
jgi:DNA-binding Xre family transcriptional regulator